MALKLTVPLRVALLQTLTEILRISGGDMRKAITFLQSAANLYGTQVRGPVTMCEYE